MCRNGQYCNTFSSKTYEKIYKYNKGKGYGFIP